MLLARRITLRDLDDARAVLLRVGVAAEGGRQAARGIGRPVQILLTGLSPAAVRALCGAGRALETEDALPLVVGEADRGAALVAGSHWSVFSLATRLANGGDGGRDAETVATAIGRCLSSSVTPPPDLELGASRLSFGGPAHVMGIVNVTPDSFSDGGRYLDPGSAVAHGEALAEAGAAILDVGGESTRPGADAVSAEDEIARVVPVVLGLAKTGVPVSIDTTKADVARAAIEAGAVMVNDVSGLTADPALARVVAEAGVALVVMHMRGDPRTMQAQTDYDDLEGEVIEGLAASLGRAVEAGIVAERIVVDPGIGFAKTAEQNLVLLGRVGALSVLGRPILVGPSRKSFIGHLTGAPADTRLPGTLAAVCAAVTSGAHIVRVHDVAETVQALAVTDAIRTARDLGGAFAPPAAGAGG